jgi:hypothetical protein
MRFMMFIYPAIGEDGRWEPTEEEVEAMTAYDEALVQAGVLLAGDGLHPPDEGARVRLSGGRASVTDGPFAESKEVVGGYWIIQASSKEEAVEWARRFPLAEGDMIEVRRVYEMSDYPEDLQAAGEPSEQPSAG